MCRWMQYSSLLAVCAALALQQGTLQCYDVAQALTMSTHCNKTHVITITQCIKVDTLVHMHMVPHSHSHPVPHRYAVTCLKIARTMRRVRLPMGYSASSVCMAATRTGCGA